MIKLSKYHQDISRCEHELRTDTVVIQLEDVPRPHFDELQQVNFTKQYTKSKRKNGNHKQGSIIKCHWICKCDAKAIRDLSRFRRNKSLLCANCLRKNASSTMMAEHKEKYSKLGKKNWKLGIGAWTEENGNPMHHESIKEQIKQTNLEKYGVENTLQSKELTKHIDWKEHAKHGLEIKKEKGNHPSSFEVIAKFQQTMTSKSNEEIERIKASRIKTWHETHDTPEKVRAIFECSKRIQGHIVGRFGRLFYQSRYEQHFIQACQNDNRILMMSRGPSICYISLGSKRYMFPDFEIQFVNCSKPCIIEIKSTYTAENDISYFKEYVGKRFAFDNGYCSYEYFIITGTATLTNLRNHLNDLIERLEQLCISQK